MKEIASIQLKNATIGYKKSREDIPVLRDLTFDFYHSDFIGIVGLNGIGKSTLLKSMCGLLPLLGGDIIIEGAAISQISLQDLAKRIAIVLTEKIGGFNLTALDVVAAGQIPYTNAFNQLKPENMTHIHAAMELCGIQHYQHKPVNELSDGLFQKTMIAKALAQQTAVLLLDEPSAFLDYASKHELFRLLKHLALQEQKCVLVSSHDLELLLRYCNRLFVISEGGAAFMPVEEALQNRAFLKVTGGYL